MKSKTSTIIFKMVSTALLSALGIVLMLFVKFPYPLAPWIEIEVSDVVILVGYATGGFTCSLAIAIIKTLISLLIQPSGIYYIGQLAAIISSFTYLICLFICVKVFRLFSKKFYHRIIGYVFIALINALVMTSLNYLFITPTYLAGYYTTCFNNEAVEGVVNSLSKFGGNYFTCIFVLYFPFNLIKAGLILVIYELLFNTLLFVVFKNNPKLSKYIKSKDDNENNKE